MMKSPKSLPAVNCCGPKWPSGKASAGVNQLVIGGVRGLRGGSKVFAGAGAGVDGSGFAQPMQSGAVEQHSFALMVRVERPATIGAFLPFETEPAKVFEHRSDEFGAATVGGEVFVAENELAVVLEGALLGSPECAGMPEVQKAGGRGREASAIVGGRGVLTGNDRRLRMVHSDWRQAIE